MSTSITLPTVSFERTVSDLKQGIAQATAAQAEASDKVFKTSKDVMAFQQANIEAFVQATQIFAAGAQDLVRQAFETNQAAFAEVLTGVRAIVTATSVKERIELQGNLVRTSAVWSVSEGSRFAHAGIELAEKVAAPLTARAVAAAELMTSAKA